jgi:hypothetical protein
VRPPGDVVEEKVFVRGREQTEVIASRSNHDAIVEIALNAWFYL